MRKHFNHKGMTLIEIIVVLLISSILMLICGTLIINSMGYFNTTSDANIDKLTADKLAEEIRSTLTYASKVTIRDTPPDGRNWHSISISDDHTLLIDDVEQFNEGFYNQRDFVLRATRYNDDYRMDLTFALVSDGETIYERVETLELINMKNRTITDDNTQDTLITKTMKIYYQEGEYVFQNDPEVTPPEPDPFPGGLTVEDEANCMDDTISLPQDSSSNNKGIWKAEQRYEKGNFVMYPDATGALYRLIREHDYTSNPPNTTPNSVWKKIDKNYTLESEYNAGDIIIFEEQYYQAKNTPTVWSPKVAPDVWYGPKGSAHELIEESKISPEYSDCSKTASTCSGSVADEYKQLDATNNKGTWTADLKIKSNDFVKYSGELDNGVMYWYRAVKSNTKSDVPGAKDEAKGNGWKRITPVEISNRSQPAEFSMASSYLKGDIIYYPANGFYYQAVVDNNGAKQTIWGLDPPSNPLFWTKINKPANGTCAN